jgi:hypothetical protein
MTSTLKSVVLGAGEIGRAIFNVLSPHYSVYLYDILADGADVVHKVDFLHICFPWSEDFRSEVQRYQRMFKPAHTIVHSTVPVGTCKSLAVVHSPVRGKHHAMEQSLATYTKFFGGPDASECADLFLRIGIPVHVLPKSEATEFGKILETSYLGLNIRWAQEVDMWCQTKGLSYTEVWDKFVQTYNDKCEELGQPKFPAMVPIQAKIGGHCVLPNLEFLPTGFAFTEVLKGEDVD